MRVVGTIEARMGSSRLPSKTLMPIFNDIPLLECVVKRFQACETIDSVVVATTTEPKDDPIYTWAKSKNVAIYRGFESDVLDRVVGAATSCAADAIVQMGADSAYLDYQLIDQLVACYHSGEYDYVCNDLKLTYPLGIYGHVVRVSKLIEINQRDDLSEQDRSDVVRYFWEHPGSFRILNIEAPPELNCPELRLTIDYPEDLEQAKAVYAHFDGELFTTPDILNLYRRQPELFEKTRHLVQQSAPFLSVK